MTSGTVWPGLRVATFYELTDILATAPLYGLRSTLSSAIQSLRYQRLMASTCPRSSLPIPPLIHSVSVGIPSWTGRS